MGATLYLQLRASCPADLRVLIAPFAVRSAFDSEVQPDVLVTRYGDPTEKNLPVAPVLAVELLSRSTSLVDRNLKKAHYERIGVPCYWILDPAGDGALTAFANEGGGYAQIAHVVGEQLFVAWEPFDVSIVPARLLDGLHPR